MTLLGRRTRRLVTSVLLVAAIAVPVSSEGAAASAGLLTPVPLELADTSNLFDLGITDINGDGIPDLYSTNHNARQDIMLGDGQLGFTNVVTPLGLDQDPTLPGAEIPGPPPTTAAGGVYLWRVGDTQLAIHATVKPGVPNVALTLITYGEVTDVADPGVSVTITATTDSAGRPATKVRVTATTTGTATLDSELVGVPMRFSVAKPSSPSKIFIGPGSLHPAAASFDWRLQDRHGIAWSDVNGDGTLDAFIVRGGLRGNIGSYPGLISDELLVDQGGRFTDVTPSTGIAKADCRGRRAVWVDFDGDGDLDLEVTCTDGPPQLWRRDGALTFTNVSNLLPSGIDDTIFTWLDTNGDRRPELIGSRTDGVGVYGADQQGVFTLRHFYPSSAAPFTGIAYTDIDENGSADVLFESSEGSLLLSGRPNGAFVTRDPATLGLPATARAVSFVDVDRDGRTDLLAMPGGVYRQLPSHRFKSTGVLSAAIPASARAVADVWFDGDGDGDPEAIIGYATNPGPKDWNVTMYENHAAPSHWLALDLVGPHDNREAIGAKVTVVAGGVTTYHWVGEADTAQFSQGQYRIDVSLGRTTTTIDSLTIAWPDGSVQTLNNVAADRRLVVTEPSS